MTKNIWLMYIVIDVLDNLDFYFVEIASIFSLSSNFEFMGERYSVINRETISTILFASFHIPIRDLFSKRGTVRG